MTERDKLYAAIKFLKELGAKKVQLRYYDDDDPAVWVVVALFSKGRRSQYAKAEISAAVTPTAAALLLCEKLSDAIPCPHCKKRMAFEPDLLSRMPLPSILCWYQYDPELKTYRRGCE